MRVSDAHFLGHVATIKKWKALELHLSPVEWIKGSTFVGKQVIWFCCITLANWLSVDSNCRLEAASSLDENCIVTASVH